MSKSKNKVVFDTLDMVLQFFPTSGFKPEVLRELKHKLNQWKDPDYWCEHLTFDAFKQQYIFIGAQLVDTDNWEFCPIKNCYVKRP